MFALTGPIYAKIIFSESHLNSKVIRLTFSRQRLNTSRFSMPIPSMNIAVENNIFLAISSFLLVCDLRLALIS